ncbi:hypothetical protein FQZ97_1226850 [compost metagenome]
MRMAMAEYLATLSTPRATNMSRAMARERRRAMDGPHGRGRHRAVDPVAGGSVG